MLNSNGLKTKLREFCDPDFVSTLASFRGFPTTKAAARAEWALVFANYVTQAEEDVTPTMPPGHPTMSMTSVKTAFEGALVLAESISAAASAADFAGAWQAGIGAITPLGLVPDTTGNTAYTFLMFTNVTPQHDALCTTLTTLFSNPTISTVQRLGDIAAAFHAATDGLSASFTKTIVATGVGNPAVAGIK